MVFFAFIGFDAVSTAAQEARRPQKDMPIGILGSLAVCTILYVLVAAVLTGLVPYKDLNVPDPIAKGVDVIGIGWFSIADQARGAHRADHGDPRAALRPEPDLLHHGQDGLLPKMFSHVHPTYQTPYRSQVLIGIAVALVAALVPINILGEMVSIGTLAAFILVCGSVIYLRRTDRHMKRPFRVPAVPVVPILGILFCLLLMAGLPLDTWLRLVIWMAIGLVIYFFYGRKHSVLRRKDGTRA